MSDPGSGAVSDSGGLSVLRVACPSASSSRPRVRPARPWMAGAALHILRLRPRCDGRVSRQCRPHPTCAPRGWADTGGPDTPPLGEALREGGAGRFPVPDPESLPQAPGPPGPRSLSPPRPWVPIPPGPGSSLLSLVGSMGRGDPQTDDPVWRLPWGTPGDHGCPEQKRQAGLSGWK